MEAIVITTINPPTGAVQATAEGAQRHGFALIVIGDADSPMSFPCNGAQYYSLDRQKALPFNFAALCPERRYSRKNIGYLIAMNMGANFIVETDDDNYPLDSFWEPRFLDIEARLAPVKAGWTNIYKYFGDANIWPRGLPLTEILVSSQIIDTKSDRVQAHIQQGLADGNPDVDAIYRLTSKLPHSFGREKPIALMGTWSPFNSQNTTWYKKVFPLLYLPSYCSFRMTDIWRSFVAQRIMYKNGWPIVYHAPTVFQERNEHNLMNDFSEEIPGYLRNDQIMRSLNEVPIKSGEEYVSESLKICYEEMVRIGVLESLEIPLLEAWLTDVQEIIER